MRLFYYQLVLLVIINSKTNKMENTKQSETIKIGTSIQKSIRTYAFIRGCRGSYSRFDANRRYC